VKVLVLAIIVGIGTGLFAEFQVHPDEPSIDHALVVVLASLASLASLALLALGIFGPGIATGLISGGPQLGAGAMAGAALGTAGLAAGVGAAATGAGAAVAAGARMASGAKLAAGARSLEGQFATAGGGAAAGGTAALNNAANVTTDAKAQPAWARRLQRRRQISHAATTVAHTLRGGDGGSSGSGPNLRDSDA
jgi:type IV secretion system protein TrbL